MVNDTDSEALNRLKEEFRQVVEVYNVAIRTGRVRAIRPAAAAAHQAIFALSKTVQTLHPDQIELIAEIEAAFMDLRWGRAVAKKSQ